MRNLTEAKVRQKIAAILKKEGSQVRAALKLGISQSYFNDLLHGRRALSDEVCAKLGVTRTTHYTWSNKNIKVSIGT